MLDLDYDDGSAAVATLTVQVGDGVNTANQEVTVSVTAQNDAPVAQADAIELAEGATATALVGAATSLLANDSDPGRRRYAHSRHHAGRRAAARHAHAVLGRHVQLYARRQRDVFRQLHLSDPRRRDATSTATVAITVTPVNDQAPTFTSAAAAQVAENNTAVVTVQATDADLPAQTLVYSITAGPIRRCSRSTLAPAS